MRKCCWNTVHGISNRNMYNIANKRNMRVVLVRILYVQNNNENKRVLCIVLVHILYAQIILRRFT